MNTEAKVSTQYEKQNPATHLNPEKPQDTVMVRCQEISPHVLTQRNTEGKKPSIFHKC